jgi:3',5'-nucleoside bisphosphate phosphatase
VRASGGVSALAHPLNLGLGSATLDSLIGELAAAGLTGLECLYGRYNGHDREALSNLARRHSLVITGGSDYHGKHKPDLRVGVGRGDLHIRDEVLDELRERLPS